MIERIENIPLADLHPFPGNPFTVREDADFQESIQEYGVIAPLVVRPLDSGGYEIISGHRRMAACEAAGIDTVPAVVRSMDDNAAIIALVDANLHREHVLPSEKAHAYKMKLDAIKRQGERSDLTASGTCGRLVHKSRDDVAASESGRNVQRYIRLTELNPQILQMVDSGKIALSPAVEISYLTNQEQSNLLETMDTEERTPSYAQTVRMRRLSGEGRLDMDSIFTIMAEEKPNQKEQIKLKADNIRPFFPKGYTARQMEDAIMKLLADWQRKREQRNRDAR
jgi:ParB family chromosome partitioning protein